MRRLPHEDLKPPCHWNSNLYIRNTVKKYYQNIPDRLVFELVHLQLLDILIPVSAAAFNRLGKFNLFENIHTHTRFCFIDHEFFPYTFHLYGHLCCRYQIRWDEDWIGAAAFEYAETGWNSCHNCRMVRAFNHSEVVIGKVGESERKEKKMMRWSDNNARCIKEINFMSRDLHRVDALLLIHRLRFVDMWRKIKA